MSQKLNNNSNKYSQTGNIFVNKTGYCSKCLRELDEDRVVDTEGNEFCDFECKQDFHRENRRELESLMREFY